MNAGPDGAKAEPPGIGRWLLRTVGTAVILTLLTIILVGPNVPLDKGAWAPPTTGKTLTGEDFHLSAWRGRVVVVNVWATWCPPCLEELPEFAEVARGQPDVAFVALAADSPLEHVQALAARLQLPFAVVAIDGATQKAWNATALPSTYIVDREGRVAWSTRGAIHGHELEAALRSVGAIP